MADGGKLIIKIDGDDSGFQKETGNLSKVGSAALKGLAIGAAAVGAAIVAIGTSAIKAYGEYEQLVGGVDTLFKESSQTIQEYAANAYKTAGLSANEYMSTVTGFSASLLQSLGGDTQKSAEYANMAVTDMSDNANKMGTSMESIQNAYQGFAKQNYTMLDNLKLGYGGTKEEMARLLEDAGKISGIEYDISSFADVTEAIHVMQEQMGIAGTTALEASSTIQGSLGMLKGAWENLMTGLSDPEQDIGVLIDNVFNSIVTVAENLMPRITQVLSGIGSVITKLVPPLLQAITDMIPVLLPVIVDGVVQIANALVGAFPVIINALLSQLPSIIQAGLDIIIALAMGLAQYLPELIPAVVDAVITIVETLIDNIDMLIDAAIAIILALADGLIKSLPTLIEKIPEIVIKLVDALVENAPKLIMAALQLILMLGKGLIQAIPTLIKNIPQILTAIFKGLTAGLATLLNIGKQLVEGLWDGIIKAKDWLLNKIKGFAKTITQGIKNFFGIKSPSRVMRDEVGKMMTKGLAVGIDEGKTEVEKVMDKMNKTLLESEVKYLEESERLEKEKADAELAEKIKNAKDQEAIDKIYADEAKKQQENENKAYLDNLKKVADEERTIYEARQKDIENAQTAIRDTFKQLAEEAFDSIEEIEKAQGSLAEKLSNFGDLYTTETKKTWRGDVEVVKLADIEKQTQALEDYAQALLDVQARGDVPQEFFATLRDLSVEEGTKFAEALLKSDDETFNKYIEDWKTKQATADELSQLLYADEAENVKSEIAKSFEKFDEDLEIQGQQNAEAWGKGFLEEVRMQIPSILEKINAAFGDILGVPSYALATGNTVQNYTTYNDRGNVVVEGVVELDGREVGRMVVDEGNAELRRRGI